MSEVEKYEKTTPEREMVDKTVFDLYAHPEDADEILGPFLEKEAAYWEWRSDRSPRLSRTDAHLELCRAYQQAATAPYFHDISLEIMRRTHDLVMQDTWDEDDDGSERYRKSTDTVIRASIARILELKTTGKYEKLWGHACMAADMLKDAFGEYQPGQDSGSGLREALQNSFVDNLHISTCMLLMSSIGHASIGRVDTESDLIQAAHQVNKKITTLSSIVRPVYRREFLLGECLHEALQEKNVNSLEIQKMWLEGLENIVRKNDKTTIRQCLEVFETPFLDPEADDPELLSKWEHKKAGRCGARFPLPFDAFDLQIIKESLSEGQEPNAALAFHTSMQKIMAKTLIADPDYVQAIKRAGQLLEAY